MFVAGSSSIFNGDISDYRDNIRELRKSIIWQWVFMKVSVIVTAYNKENYIRKCLKSVINQDCNDWELIDNSRGWIYWQYKGSYWTVC